MGLLTELLRFGGFILPGKLYQPLDDIKGAEKYAADEMLFSDEGLAWTKIADKNTVTIGEVTTKNGRIVDHRPWFRIHRKGSYLEAKLSPNDDAKATLDVFTHSKPEMPLTQLITDSFGESAPFCLGEEQFGKLRYETRGPNVGPEATFIIDQQGIRPLTDERPVRQIEEIIGRDTHIKSIRVEPSST